ncbi:MAG: phosphatase PAP2 family protein [Chloroflexota bacterium]
MVNYPQMMIRVGVTLFIIGLTHLIPGIALRDAQAFRYLHAHLRGFSTSFRLLWHLGRTPFALLVILLMVLLYTELGVSLAIIFVLIISFEWFIKRSLQRVRPFNLIPDTLMSQPKEPGDPSFPSGDALRIWFIALALPVTLGATWPLILFVSLIALLISLGRIGLGVHYPLDVVGGSGLGMLGAGIWLQLISKLL